MKYFILVIAIASSKVFFSASSIFGINYEGAAESSVYVIYTAAVALLACGIYFARVIHAGGIGIMDVKLLSIPFLLIIWFSLEFVISGGLSEESLRTGGFFVLWSFPAMLCGLYLARERELSRAFKYFDLLNVVFTLSALVAVILPFFGGGGFETLAGASYQTMSYIAAIAFGLNLNFLFLGKNARRFDFANTRPYQIISVCMLPFQLASVVIPGGRGATILSLVYMILLPALSYKIKAARNRNRMMIVLGGFLLVGALYLPTFLAGSDIASSGLERALQFLGSDGQLDWEGSSGRDVIYAKALSLIADRPIFGYGLFGFSENLGASYAHNIFLDVLLSGGIFFLLATIAAIWMMIVRAKSAIKVDESFSVVIVFLVYAVVSLMFSGTFLVASEFWFVFFLIFAWRPRPRASADARAIFENQKS